MCTFAASICAYLVHWVSGETSGKNNNPNNWDQYQMLVASWLLLQKPHFDDMHKSDCHIILFWILPFPVYSPWVLSKTCSYPKVLTAPQFMNICQRSVEHSLCGILVLLLLPVEVEIPSEVTQKSLCNWSTQFVLNIFFCQFLQKCFKIPEKLNIAVCGSLWGAKLFSVIFVLFY